MLVKWVRAYFNSTDAAAVAQWEKECKPGGEVCEIEEYVEGATPKLLVGGGKGTGGQGGNGGKGEKKNAGVGGGDEGLTRVWFVLLGAFAVWGVLIYDGSVDRVIAGMREL